jgi:SAM-dependent methyltransferase
MNRPSKRDVSRPRGDGYAYKKAFYRRADVAADYDFHRFGDPRRTRRNARKWRTILSALRETDGVRSILDLPCGTGRFTGPLTERGYTVLGGDISREMMQRAREKTNGAPSLCGFVQADAEALPLRDASLDCVLSIRFMFHVDPDSRVRILREMGRVSRRWLIVDYRHRYSLRWAKWRLLRRLGLTNRRFERVSREQLEREFHAAGIAIRKVIPVRRVFSDKWIVVGESANPTAA